MAFTRSAITYVIVDGKLRQTALSRERERERESEREREREGENK